MRKYNIYASLLDGFQNYLDSSEIFQTYWGFSDNAEKTEEQFEAEQYQSLIDRINRVPFDSEAADKGTAFNEVVDCIIENRKSEKMELSSGHEFIQAVYNNRTFYFPRAQTIEFAKQFTGALSQVYTEAILPTKYGDILIYGYIDELLPTSCHDIKTTSKYKAFKFNKAWQKIVYPYCLNAQGNSIYDFEYNVVVIGNELTFYDEYYLYKPERDVKLLTNHCEQLIEFLETNRDKITDRKIFNLDSF